jgi:GDPmannose 4,6-dehydratase
MGNRALIFGISGQDGSYLAEHLIKHGYDVIGTSRDAESSPFSGLVRLGVKNKVKTISVTLADYHSVLKVIKEYRPDEIYNLAGQSSVRLSFDQPVETIESNVLGTLNILEAIRFLNNRTTKFYNAGSSESFGETSAQGANEYSPFRPKSPYGVAKASAHNLVQSYREAFDLFACTGTLFNHESPLRPYRFVTQKIVTGAYQISCGVSGKLNLGNIDIERDWGWAPEYVIAMWKMLQQSDPQDYIIATGRTVPLRHLVKEAFRFFNLNYLDHVEINNSLYRPSDIVLSMADPTKSRVELNWKANISIEEVIVKMCQDHIDRNPKISGS